MRLMPIVGLRPGGAAMLAAFAVLAAWQPVIAGAVETEVTHQEPDAEAEVEPAERSVQEPPVVHKELLLGLIGVVFLLIGINGGGY